DSAGILGKGRISRDGVQELLGRGGAGVRGIPDFARSQRSPSRDFRAAQPVHIARLEHRAVSWRPHPSENLATSPSAVMIGQPSPRLIAHPRVAQRAVPTPPALLKRRPAVGRLGFPHRAEIGSLYPLARGIEILNAIALHDVRG